MLKTVFSLLVLPIALAPTSFAQGGTVTFLTASAKAAGYRTIDLHRVDFIRADSGADWSRYRQFRVLSSAYEPSCPKHELAHVQPEQAELSRAAEGLSGWL